jgi:RNA polymerase sigma-70 factor (ECF subfamily)
MLELQSGNEAALDCILAHYQSGVFHFVLRSIRDHGRAEDLTQEVFFRVYRSRASYTATAAFKTWLFTIAHRLALNELRALRRRRRVFSEATPTAASGGDRGGPESFWSNVADATQPTPLECLEEKELQKLIEKLLGRLPENQRMALELKRSQDFSYNEIAAILEVSIKAVKSLLVRAREKLKTEVELYLSGHGRMQGQEP